MLQSSLPLVSIIIPAYNAESFIGETLDSVLSQTYRNLEVIVVDDGSSDRTVEVIQRYAARDPRIVLVQQTNGGVAAARNRGIRQAKGEFVAPVDADDIWVPEALALMVQRFATAPAETGVVYGWSVDIDGLGQTTGGFHAATVEGSVLKTLLCHNFLGNASSTLIRRSCFDHVGGYDEQLKAQNAQGCEDWDLYLRLAEHYMFAVVPKFLVEYRKLSNAMSADFSKMARSQKVMLDKVRANHPQIPGVLYRISRGSFNLYLAQQSHIKRDVRGTLYWLWQAVKVDPVMPFCRLGVYQLVLINVMRLVQSTLRPFRKRFAIFREPGASNRSLMKQTPLPEDAPIHRSQIYIKLWVSSLLHQSLLRIL